MGIRDAAVDAQLIRKMIARENPGVLLWTQDVAKRATVVGLLPHQMPRNRWGLKSADLEVEAVAQRRAKQRMHSAPEVIGTAATPPDPKVP